MRRGSSRPPPSTGRRCRYLLGLPLLAWAAVAVPTVVVNSSVVGRPAARPAPSSMQDKVGALPPMPAKVGAQKVPVQNRGSNRPLDATAPPRNAATTPAQSSAIVHVREAAPPPGIVGRLKAELETTVAELNRTKANLGALTDEVKLLRSELNKVLNAVLFGRRATLRLEQQVASLYRPWLGHSGEVQCMSQHRCTGYKNAGEESLGAVSSVRTCMLYCNQTFPGVPFFAYHSMEGMTAFANDPKGRCRCYDSPSCDLVPDSGYNLWSTTGRCDFVGELEQ